MARGMLLRSIPRSVIERGRWRATAEGALVADIRPDMPSDRFSLRQEWHRGVVAMQTFASQDMGLDQRMERSQDRGAGAHLVGQRRHTQIDALTGVAFALPVQRLMLPELLKQDHRQKVRSGKAARRHVERRRRLRDLLAFPAGKLFP